MATEIKKSRYLLGTLQGTHLEKEPVNKKHELSSEKEPLQGLRVLYVEDQAVLRKQMQKVEEIFHWVLTLAETGQEGFAFARKNEYDIILMDIILGVKSDYNGYETARKIKAIKPHLIIVSFSTSPMEARIQKGSEMDGHLEKDISVRYLQEALLPYFLPPQVEGKNEKLVQKKKRSNLDMR